MTKQQELCTSRY